MILNEDWYDAGQLQRLMYIARTENIPATGDIIEIGCWEGKSTMAIANTVAPRIVHCIDTWRGNIDESPDHVSVQIAKQRDVLEIFSQNMTRHTLGNFVTHVMDWRDFFARYRGVIAFIHIDGSHDYKSVSETLRAVFAHVQTGTVICGDDYLSTRGRTDLDGGVARAVEELLPGFNTFNNLWYWSKK